MGQPFLYEFLYRGRPAGSAEPPAWHVVLGQSVTLPGASEAQFVASGALTPSQAEAAGFPLAAVLAGIDAAALSGRDAAVSEAEAARAERDAAKAEAEAAQRERDAAMVEAEATRRDRDAAMVERDALAAQLAGREPVPGASLPAVSDRQFFQVLAQVGAIGTDEALAAVMRGVLPARIEAAVTALPQAEQFAARMLLSGATAFERGHPMVAQLGATLGYDAAALDTLWRQAATL